MDTGILIFLIAFGVIVVPCLLWTWHAICKRRTEALRVQHSVRSLHSQRNFYAHYGPIRNDRQRVREWELPPGTGGIRSSQLPGARSTFQQYERRIQRPREVQEKITMTDEARVEGVYAVLPDSGQGEQLGQHDPTLGGLSGSRNDNGQPRA